MSSLLVAPSWLPYTEEEEAITTRRTPISRAACSTFTVPVAFISWQTRGSATERGTEGRAARCRV